jgi:hypothetical protein
VARDPQLQKFCGWGERENHRRQISIVDRQGEYVSADLRFQRNLTKGFPVET